MGTPAVVRFRGFDANGAPLAGGKLWTYQANTTTKKATYSDPDCTIPNTNPVVLDSEGYADVWMLSGSYKFALYNSLDVPQWVRDDIPASSSASDGDTSGAGFSAWVTHEITDGESATDLEGETLDLLLYSSAYYKCEIIRGTTVFANGPFAVQNVNGTVRVVTGGMLSEEAHGVTFSVSQTTDEAQLKVTTSSGPGAGTVKLCRILTPA